MPEHINVYYDGWGEHWRWGSLVSSSAITGRPLIVFEFSDEALSRGLELSALRLPLQGPRLRKGFPDHQMGLPGPVYDALPDGWGMLLMDRLFKRHGLNPARISPLSRLAYIGSRTMGAMSFEPAASEASASAEDITLAELAAEIQDVLSGAGGAFLQKLLQIGGSPHGARPKALLYRDAGHENFTTAPAPGLEAWMVKFPAQHEHPEVCTIEAIYAECLRECDIDTPQTEYFELPNGQAAFASKRFDRQQDMRVPMQSLAAFTGANFRNPGELDYVGFLRATGLCTNDVREKARAFERAVFNVVFNNRDDHPKNFAYIMSAAGQWALTPAYDVTFCEGPGGYHQMDLMGEALNITRKHLLALGSEETDLSAHEIAAIIDRTCQSASGFTTLARRLHPGRITQETLRTVQGRIDENIRLLR